MTYEPAEYALLSDVIDAAGADEPRRRYAAWLAERGDEARARVIRASSLASLDLASLDEALEALDTSHFAWSRLVGAQLVREVCRRDLRPHLEAWWKLARPAFELVIGPREDAPVGASRLWGDPDLPEGTPWPTLGQCQRWEDFALPADDPCQFVAQIDLAELAASPAARELPRQGLLSVFSHLEMQKTGSAALHVRHFAEGPFVRAPHVSTTSEENARRPPQRLTLREALTIPDAGWSPFSKTMGIGEKDWDTLEAHREVLFASGGGLLGLLGHTRATSGADPAPTTEWGRLINVPLDPECMRCHVAIRDEDLRAGRLEAHELVWVDFDGE
ncbi:MAG: DUF1963 domain-containing protein [Sandaracinus sp.]|nr:DUF1963 domain-containing protein [Myxococcales bacterium]MCB9631334.1 DUF1963 domain-containing protein [Sandaracinus sp.]